MSPAVVMALVICAITGVISYVIQSIPHRRLKKEREQLDYEAQVHFLEQLRKESGAE